SSRARAAPRAGHRCIGDVANGTRSALRARASSGTSGPRCSGERCGRTAARAVAARMMRPRIAARPADWHLLSGQRTYERRDVRELLESVDELERLVDRRLG